MKLNLFTGRRPFATLTLLISLATILSVEAQTVNLRSPQPRITVPLNSTVSTLISNQVTLTGVTNANFSVSEVSSIPGGGCGATFDLTSRTSSGPVFITLNTTNVTQGTYTFSFNASGLDTNAVVRTNNLLFILQAGYVWNGTNNAVAGGAGNWSDSTKWLGGAAPGAGDEVIFSDLGGQTNSVVTTPTTTNLLVNSVVDVDTTIGSLRFSQTNSSTAFHTLRIDPGRKLTITGTSGFSLLRDYIDEFAGIAAGMTVTIVGTNATMVVTNPTANFALLVDGIITHTLDMTRLDNFAATVNIMGMGDQYIYPNFWNFQANNYGGIPRRMVPFVNMAKTNVITAHFADANNYTNAVDRQYGIQFVGTVSGNGSVGASPLPLWNLGISNVFFADSVLVGGANQRATLQFNPLFATNYPCVAIFRGTNGGRMSMFASADAAGTNGSQGNIKTEVNFGPNGGSVDMLVDRFYIGRDRPSINAAQTPNYQGFFTMGKGIVDANTVVLGFREYDERNYTNFWGYTTNYAWNGYCEGRLTVSNSAVFKVNDTLTLGYTVETSANGLGAGGNTEWGQIILANGGTVMANKILVGGPGINSVNNTITLDRSTLIVSNTLGQATQTVNQLSFANNSSLTLHLNGTNTGYYVHATNLTVAAGSTLNIASVANLPIPPDGTNVPVFSFVNGGANNFAVTMPSPMRGTVLGNNLNIITNQPKNLVWRGTVNGDWNTTTKNWLDTATGLSTNYINGDAVLFDDVGSAPDTVTLIGTLIPDSITVSNGTGNPVFIFSGSGTMPGGSLVKNGSGTLEINANTSIPVQVNAGTVKANSSGRIGSAVIASGAIMDFGVGSTISPSGVSCAGTATLRGSTVGPLLVQTGGIVTNDVGASTEGVIDTESGALLYNAGSLGSSSPGGLGIGSSTIVSNATFINAGNIGSPGVVSTLAVSGVFKDTGAGGTIYLSTLNINGGTGTNNNNAGTFIPGGDGIGTTIIRSPGVGGGNFPGRVAMGAGSTNIFKVTVDGPTNYTILRAPWIDFGPSVGTPTFNGGYLWVTNVGTTALSAGQSFGMFTLVDTTTPIQFGSTNSYPLMLPTVPGTGLAWDLSNIKPGGVVAVKTVPTTGTNITYATSFTTRTNNAGVTNLFIVSQLSWPSNYIGWHAEAQITTRDVGLRSGSTNWDPIFESYFTNQIVLTNQVTSNSVGFYRMAYP